jgi:hypothetical protein
MLLTRARKSRMNRVDTEIAVEATFDVEVDAKTKAVAAADAEAIPSATICVPY